MIYSVVHQRTCFFDLNGINRSGIGLIRELEGTSSIESTIGDPGTLYECVGASKDVESELLSRI
jgi:hypothetical protein